MSNQLNQYLTMIREQGFRVTPQRQLILGTLLRSGGHATARDVYEMVQEKVSTLNRATVYRTLDFFCELNITAKTEIDGRTTYEILGEDPHHHLVCRECGHVAVLSDKHFDHLVEHLLAEHQFKAELHHLAIPGVCQHCQNTTSLS